MIFDITAEEEDIIYGVSEGEVVSLLQSLIRNRTDYPPGDTRGAVETIAELLEREGVTFEVLSTSERQPNLIASYGPVPSRSRLVYHAHVDTVPAGDLEDWSKDPFAGEVENGWIYGRGAGDDKSSVAAQVMALIALARAEVPLSGTLQVAVVGDEESGGNVGTRWLREAQKIQPDYLVVGEQTKNRIAIAERVACGIDLTIFGESAHGAMTWAGDNAILKIARVIGWMQETYIEKLSEIKHPYLPPPTLNIGKISGGVQWNIVPGQCKIEMDRRLLPGETRGEAMEEIRDLLDDYRDTVEDLQYELFTTGDVASNIHTSPEDPFVRTAQQALFDVSGEERELTGYVQTSDGRWFADDGIPILIFGPSDPRVGHAPDEHVSVDQLMEATRFLIVLALRQLSQGSEKEI